MPKKLLWQLYLSFLLITLLSTLAVGIYASNALKSFYLDQLTAELEDNAQLIIKLLGKSVSEGQESKIDSLAKQIGEDIGKRVTIILPSGLVIGDSDEDPLRMDNHAKRPEILSAIKGDTGSSSRFSRTIGLDMLYVALPIQHDGRLVGVVRISTSMLAITHTLEKAYKRLAWAVLAMLVVTALLSLALARRISRPIREINRGAERFAAGDLDHRIPKPPIEEMEYLAGTMNKMATQLNERIRTITRQRNELEALLSGMVEAVFMVDRDGLLIWANHAFGELFKTDPIALRNQPIAEIIQHAPLMEFLHTCIRSEEPSETDIILEKKSERFLQAHGRRITDPEGTYTGALVVLNDVTRLKMLERVRQDFVANVSHELKTPITSIIGFVETLRDGAMANPEKSVEFLGIIARQAERLNAIINDLLMLSRLEHDAPVDSVRFESINVAQIARYAILTCSDKARAKDISINLTCPDDLNAPINAPLVEQAIINLVDNAIKYSETGGPILVTCHINSDEILQIAVKDSGVGIPKEELPRIFERFYRVDKARSRKMGGTGLGLSIVKHISRVHNGRVTVESEQGVGSTFTISLPVNRST